MAVYEFDNPWRLIDRENRVHWDSVDLEIDAKNLAIKVLSLRVKQLEAQVKDYPATHPVHGVV